MNENPIKWLKKIREQKHLSTYEVATASHRKGDSDRDAVL